MSKIPISVCIIAKNEEKHIGECLKHLQPYGFEIIVTDTGSDDKTKEIAEKYADKVLDFEWIDDFSAARNFCAEHASNNWILSIDCDEYVDAINMQGVRILMQKFPKYVGGFELKSIVIDDVNGQERYTNDFVTRFYNKNFYKYTNAIHEQLIRLKGEKADEYQQFKLPMEVIHHGYNIDGEKMVNKQMRNLQMLERAIEKDSQNPYLWFQTGQSRFILKEFEKAAEAYETALSLKPDVRRIYVEVLLTSLSRTYIILGRAGDAVALLKKYNEYYKTAKYTFSLACAYLENDQPLQALLHYIKAVSMKDVDALGDCKLVCYQNIMDLYRQLGQPEMAEMFTEKYEACKKEQERILNAD